MSGGPGDSDIRFYAELPVRPATAAALHCTGCDFTCTNVTALAEHIAATDHGAVACTQCPTLLVCPPLLQSVRRAVHARGQTTSIANRRMVDTLDAHEHAPGLSGSGAALPELWRFRLPRSHPAQAVGAPPAELKDQPLPASLDTDLFACPECRRVLGWDALMLHMKRENHGVTSCVECRESLSCFGTDPAKHLRLTGHRGVRGVYIDSGDVPRVPSGTIESTPDGVAADDPLASALDRAPSVEQWQCKACDVSFFSELHMAWHLQQQHQSFDTNACKCQARCLECGMTTDSIQAAMQHESALGHWKHQATPLGLDRYRVTALPKVVMEPPPVPRNCRIMYQCSECHLIFTSWTRMERHMAISRHGLPYCNICGIIEKFASRFTDEHANIDSHVLYGRQRSKSAFEVLVDIDNRDLLACIVDCNVGVTDAPATEEADPGPLKRERRAFQCPMADCLALFLDEECFEEHVKATGHCQVTCGECGETLSDPVKVSKHPHQLALPPELLFLRPTRGGNTFAPTYEVTVVEQDLLRYHPTKFYFCDKCERVVDTARKVSHITSQECAAFAARLHIDRKSGRPASDRNKWNPMSTAAVPQFRHGRGGFVRTPTSFPAPSHPTHTVGYAPPGYVLTPAPPPAWMPMWPPAYPPPMMPAMPYAPPPPMPQYVLVPTATPPSNLPIPPRHGEFPQV